MTSVEADLYQPGAALDLVVKRLNVVVPCVPVTDGGRGERNHHKVAASPSSMLWPGFAKGPIRGTALRSEHYGAPATCSPTQSSSPLLYMTLAACPDV